MQRQKHSVLTLVPDPDAVPRSLNLAVFASNVVISRSKWVEKGDLILFIV